MPLDAVQAVLRLGRFEAMGVGNTVAVDEAGALTGAMAIVQSEIALIDRACSRFRPESELSHLNRTAGRKTAVSQLLEEALVAALSAAEMTGGLVDPTVGRRMEEIGYTVTFGAMPKDGPPLELWVREVRDWRSVELDRSDHTVRVPEGVALDLGASGKAWAADRAAEAAARRLGVGVLVECGGDVAVRGRVPDGGWPVRVASDAGAADGQDIVIRDGGLATSGTTSRRWRRGGTEIHDIIDPVTGMPARTPWTMVTVAAATCLEANAAATAAVVMGDGAPAWLAARALPARLVRSDGTVHCSGRWNCE